MSVSLNSFIPISRKLFQHPFWHEQRKYSKFEAWVDMLQLACFKDTKQVVGSHIIDLKRGQFSVSLRYLATRWGWSTKKVGYFFRCLTTEKMIIKQLSEKQTLITICNYDKYNFQSKKFSVPTLNEVIAYCRDRNYTIDAGRFHAYYEACNWMRGKYKMRNWKSAVNAWERNENKKEISIIDRADERF